MDNADVTLHWIVVHNEFDLKLSLGYHLLCSPLVLVSVGSVNGVVFVGGFGAIR